MRAGEIGITHSLIGLSRERKKKEGGLSTVGTRGRGKERKKEENRREPKQHP